MKTLVFATHNPGKLREVRRLLPGEIVLGSLEDIGCREPIAETGQTLQANALLKARYVFDTYGYDCFADDTGLEVDALDGAPGVYSARYAGASADAAANISKLLKAMEYEENRKARFRTVIALILGGTTHFFEGVVEGEILRKPQGADGFGYDPVFRPTGKKASFAELSLEDKNAISHRGIALKKLRAFLTGLDQAAPSA